MKNTTGKVVLRLAALAAGLLLGTADPAACANSYARPVVAVVQNQSSHVLLVDIRVSVFSETGTGLGTCAVNQVLGPPFNSGATGCLIAVKEGQKIAGWEWSGTAPDTGPGGTALSLTGQRRRNQRPSFYTIRASQGSHTVSCPHTKWMIGRRKEIRG